MHVKIYAEVIDYKLDTLLGWLNVAFAGGF